MKSTAPRAAALVLAVTAALAVSGCTADPARPEPRTPAPGAASSPYPAEPTEGVLEEPQDWTQLPPADLGGALGGTTAVQVAQTSRSTHLRIQLADADADTTEETVAGILDQVVTDAQAGSVAGRDMVGDLEVVGYFPYQSQVKGAAGAIAFTAVWSAATLAGLEGDPVSGADTFDAHRALTFD